MKTMEFCSGSMLHGFQGNPWNFPHAFSMVFPWFSHAFSTRVRVLLKIRMIKKNDVIMKREHFDVEFIRHT